MYLLCRCKHVPEPQHMLVIVLSASAVPKRQVFLKGGQRALKKIPQKSLVNDWRILSAVSVILFVACVILCNTKKASFIQRERFHISENNLHQQALSIGGFDLA